jgi:hypothetical protein
MAEICRFLGIIIRMFPEAEARHHMPHFHVRYQEHYATYTIDPFGLIAGSLPNRQQRFVEVWSELHRGDLLEDWNLLIAGEPPLPIQPLH